MQKGKIIPDKEELVVDKENKISSLKLGGDKILPQKGRRELGEPNPINRKDPLQRKKKAILTILVLFSLLIAFVDLIIGEAVGPPLLERHFLQVHIALLMLRESDDQDPYNLTFGGFDDQGSNNLCHLWEVNKKSRRQAARD